jgi:hypothetical protein
MGTYYIDGASPAEQLLAINIVCKGLKKLAKEGQLREISIDTSFDKSYPVFGPQKVIQQIFTIKTKNYKQVAS